MSKQKAFKRKLKKPHFGVHYYRIWGWPLKSHSVAYHQELYGNDPTVVIFEHPTFGWLRLNITHCIFGDSRDRVSASAFNRSRLSPYPLSGAISDRYYRKREQALRILREYGAGIRHDGLAEMIWYHERVDEFDNGYVTHD